MSLIIKMHYFAEIIVTNCRTILAKSRTIASEKDKLCSIIVIA